MDSGHDGGLAVSVLDLVGMRAGESAGSAIGRSVDLAQHVERLGYKRYWLAEHHSIPGLACAATAVLIGHVAGATKTIRVGSGGVMLPNHASLVVAEQFGTLDAMYPGRIDLGLGRAPGSDRLTSQALRFNATEGAFPQQVNELLAYLGPQTTGRQIMAYPGVESNVPVWLLGSSTYSAELAAELSLPFAFASHFAPALLFEAIDAYRSRFKPSVYLDKPYVAAGIPLVGAASDEEAARLATSSFQRFLNVIRGKPIFVLPPVDSMQGLWSESERSVVESKFGVAVIGGPDTVQQKPERFLRATNVDELIFV